MALSRAWEKDACLQGMRATEYCPVQPQLAVWALMTHFLLLYSCLQMILENTSGIDFGVANTFYW